MMFISSSLLFYMLSFSFILSTYSFTRIVNTRSNMKNILHSMPKTTDPIKVDVDLGKNEIYSFVNNDLRAYAMKLHTKDQSPREGQQKQETPFTQWVPSRVEYLQFLVDSLRVYEVLEEITRSNSELSPFVSTGLERAAALQEDISWMLSYDSSLILPICGPAGEGYAKFLKQIASESLPKFICHYYNQYFAHTAGGRMIGKKMSDLLLEGKVLRFYEV